MYLLNKDDSPYFEFEVRLYQRVGPMGSVTNSVKTR